MYTKYYFITKQIKVFFFKYKNKLKEIENCEFSDCTWKYANVGLYYGEKKKYESCFFL